MINKKKRKLQNTFEQRCQIVDDLKNKIRQFEVKLKDNFKNSLISSWLFDAEFINVERELLSGHNEDEQI